ncbi:hypothetical protein V8C86DRAFT_2554317 [Haematococcus lacustris]
MVDHGEVFANFVAITGAEDGIALQTLEATNWQLDEAVQLFFATAPNQHDTAAPASSAGADKSLLAHDDDEVRAPLPSTVARLYGDHVSPGVNMAALAAHGLQGPSRPQPPINVFSDNRADWQPGSKARDSGSTQPGSSGRPESQTLSAMFKAPSFAHPGDFGTARAEAAKRGKWLLLNILDVNEFASHQLNRDTWGNEAMPLMLGPDGIFVFHQAYASSSEGKQLVSNHRLTRLPCTLVIDPLTGAKLYAKAGFVSAEVLMEELVPFMDHGPQDPEAGKLALQMSMKSKGLMQQQPLPRAAAGSEGAGSRQPGAGSVSGVSSTGGGTEEEQLALALAMSMEEAGPTSVGAGQPAAAEAANGHDEDMKEAAGLGQAQPLEPEAAARPKPEEVSAAAAARLPPEPDQGAAESCRVALRLPSGERLQRRFLLSHTVQALHDLVVSSLLEAAGGRAFSMAAPDAPPLTDCSVTLRDAQCANSMLVVRWL